MRIILIVLLSLASFSLYCQDLPLIHSHNDYYQDLPLWHAYEHGASSIEVDVFLRGEDLCVGHTRFELRKKNTLSKLYLEPLNQLAADNALRPISLLIDVKTEAHASLDQIVKTINKFSNLSKSQKIKFVISGKRPAPKNYNNYPDFILFDHQILDDLDVIDLSKVAMVSRSFRSYASWNGRSNLSDSDLEKIKLAIAKAKSMGKPFRFWGTPDTERAWKLFRELGVGYINTDRPGEVAAWFDR